MPETPKNSDESEPSGRTATTTKKSFRQQVCVCVYVNPLFSFYRIDSKGIYDFEIEAVSHVRRRPIDLRVS